MSSNPSPLSINNIITVNVSAASGLVAPRIFNQALIVGRSTVIPTYGANPRLRQYTSLSEMLTDGFIDSDPEYLAAQLFFGTTPAGDYVWIGRCDTSAIETAIPHSGSAGTGYVVGDIVGVTQGGAEDGFLRVSAVSGGGVVTALSTIIGQQGTGYTVASGLATTGGSGTGLTVDVTVVGETYLQAVQACAQFGYQWYGFMACNATDADHLSLAAYSNANWQTLLYFGTTTDVAVANGTAGNICDQLQALLYKALMIYSTTQGGEFPDNVYSCAALLGLYCGLDTGGPGSAFTLANKQVAGVAPEPLTQAQLDAISGANCNVIADYGAFIGLCSLGILESGDYFDQILYRATLVNLIQVNLMNLLVSVPKIPQTDAGEHQLLSQVDAACAAMVTVGYIGPNATWDGQQILNLAPGGPLPLGYLNQAPPYSQQSSGDRKARKAMPISSAIVEAGAVQSVVVDVNVQL
jgi:hypothetical protein